MQEILDGLGQPIPQRWLDLNFNEQLWWAQDTLNQLCDGLGLKHVFVTDIKNNHRIVLAEHEPDEAFGRAMLKFEVAMRHIMGFGIELQLESLDDKNKRATRQLMPVKV